MKNKIALLYSNKTPLVDAMVYQLSSFDLDLFEKTPINADSYNLVICLDKNFEGKYKGLACHHSLLPAFNSPEPVYDAIVAGAKVTGITIYYTEPFKIIAQYPLIINNSAHFDEIETQLSYLEQIIFPLVAEKYAKNEPFEISDLLKSHSCKGACSSCSGCN